MKTFQKLVVRNDRINADFCIELSSHPPVFMRVIEKNYLNSERAVIEVDASRFLDFWRLNATSGQKQFANCGIAAWKQDRKFQDAEDGFARGEDDPVPTANIEYCETIREIAVKKKTFLFGSKIDQVEKITNCSLEITNGITRIMWLLVHGATAFPVECNINNAEELCKHIGSSNVSVTTVQKLLKL